MEPVPEAVAAENLASSAPSRCFCTCSSSLATRRALHEAAENRNRIYAGDIREDRRARPEEGPSAARLLDERDFFTLLECLGLAAWRGNGRTGSTDDFSATHALHAGRQAQRFDSLPDAALGNVAVMLYTRRDLEGQGFDSSTRASASTSPPAPCLPPESWLRD